MANRLASKGKSIKTKPAESAKASDIRELLKKTSLKLKRQSKAHKLKKTKIQGGTLIVTDHLGNVESGSKWIMDIGPICISWEPRMRK